MDPVASLRPAEIDLDLGEYTYTIPALTAAEWIEVLAEGKATAIMPGLLPPADRLAVLRDYLSGAISSRDLLDGVHRIMEVAGGRRWWEVQKIVDSALQENVWPTVHGQLVIKGVDLDRLTLAGFVNAVFYLIMSSCQKDSERQAMEWEITKPPPGYLEEMEETGADEFEAMLGEQSRLAGG